jgi:hypothetical protein
MSGMEHSSNAEESTPSRRKVIVGLGATAAAMAVPKLIAEVTPEDSSNNERVEDIRGLLAGAQNVLEIKGREEAKLLLPDIYNNLIFFNGRSQGDEDIWIWNPRGSFTKEAFDELNLQRKKLSNAIGIQYKTESGEVKIRHDLNEI